MYEDSVAWNDLFSVGFEPIDNQHKNLVLMTNELFLACKEGVVAADIAFLQTVKKAVKYAETHFADEEDYMLEANYPHFDEQKKQHEDFVATVIKMIEEFEAGNTEPVEMARYLKKWLLNHIAISDKKYMPYLAK
jgi:hemerythrin